MNSFRAIMITLSMISMTGICRAESIVRPEVRHPAKNDRKPADMSKPVNVFILLGQSNMVGFGSVNYPAGAPGTLEIMVKNEGKYAFLVDDTGKWLPRNDVRCVYMRKEKNGWLQPGFGTTEGAFGPELGFGYVMGQTLDAPVLLIKACRGNRSLGGDFLPPGSEPCEVNGKMLAGYKAACPSWERGAEPKPIIDKKTGKESDWYAGKQYDEEVAIAKKVLEDIGKYYPGATKYEIAGFVWWQGHKDQNADYASRYEANLVALIKALRKDFNAPKALFVLATGCGNSGTESYGLQIAQAQLAMNDKAKYPQFAGTVMCVDSRGLWPKPEDSPSKKEGYHYYWNAGTVMDVGLLLGQAMADLQKESVCKR